MLEPCVFQDEQQIEALQDGKRTLYERYLMGEIDLNTYKAEKAACDELLLKTKNAYAAVLAQAKQKQDEQTLPQRFCPAACGHGPARWRYRNTRQVPGSCD